MGGPQAQRPLPTIAEVSYLHCHVPAQSTQGETVVPAKTKHARAYLHAAAGPRRGAGRAY